MLKEVLKKALKKVDLLKKVLKKVNLLKKVLKKVNLLKKGLKKVLKKELKKLLFDVYFLVLSQQWPVLRPV